MVLVLKAKRARAVSKQRSKGKYQKLIATKRGARIQGVALSKPMAISLKLGVGERIGQKRFKKPYRKNIARRIEWPRPLGLASGKTWGKRLEKGPFGKPAKGWKP